MSCGIPARTNPEAASKKSTVPINRMTLAQCEKRMNEMKSITAVAWTLDHRDEFDALYYRAKALRERRALGKKRSRGQ